MRLSDFLLRKGLSQVEFAALIGVDQATVSRYVTGDRLPSLPVSLRIREVTKGWVKPDDFVLK